jgi:hypothetical protein
MFTIDSTNPAKKGLNEEDHQINEAL